MASQLHALCIDAVDPARLAAFWSALLGWEETEDTSDGVDLLPGDDTGFRLRLVATAEPKRTQNLMHLDLTSTSPEAQEQTVARVLELGGRRVDVGQRPEEGHVVLGDPEGNEVCVIEAGNRFLAGCGFVGALACDGSRAVGHFWSEALGWPLVWDQDEETAVRAPYGGPKVTWGGPPLMPRAGRSRLRFDLAAGGDLGAEVDRLVSLGAARLGPEPSGAVAMTDPDGGEFRVLDPTGRGA